ncbi:2-phospho-L-lactate guanylyltransferase [Enterovirga sp.]|jgi:2-phospho-L-lactate guanylyltransferase|uniref:2-phospho-L-lactate guanylyltransferase n=1 Tax=Enterovirga sp. TaxID=2026350 RepID=UPI002624D981|nr:2-phospho-L-lactate guanylyltransferase [Enterovirga sp.]MDB5590558.1 2-Phospho-l-lactate Guanylyltransferase,CofC [Enterovirga sp.]
MKDIWAVLPVKSFRAAKQRLGPAHPALFRQGLARAMVEDVLAGLQSSRLLAGFVVVTSDPDAAALGAQYGGRVVREEAEFGQTAAVTAVGAMLAAEGRGGMLTIPGDVPGITGAELDRVIEAHGEGPSFTIVPAHDRRGSNCVVMSPPNAVQLSFGNDSFLVHLDAARARGIEPRIIEMRGIGLDVDNPNDLCSYAACAGDNRTRSYLKEAGYLDPVGTRPAETRGAAWL